MTILLTLLSLLATDCRVHQPDSVKCWATNFDNVCIVADHYIDTCAVKMRCDTVWTHRYWIEQTPDGTRGREDSFRVIDCYPDTAESDSGLITWFGVAPLPPPDSYLPRSYPAPLDSAELANIREMIREWRVARCVQTAIAKAKDNGSWWFGDVDDRTLRDSCRCLYRKDGGGK